MVIRFCLRAASAVRAEKKERRKVKGIACLACVVMLCSAFAADSATSQAGVIDSRLRTSGSAAAPLLEARSGQTDTSVDTFNIDTATAIGTLIMFR